MITDIALIVIAICLFNSVFFLNKIVRELRVISHRGSIRNAAEVIILIAKDDTLLDHQSFEMLRSSAVEIMRLTK